MKLEFGIKEALDLIPYYSGYDICEYVHFQQGCKDALELLGIEHEKILLKFLKLKLKSMAYSQFSLDAGKYNSLSEFLKDVEKEYPGINKEDSWNKNVLIPLHQEKYEPLRDYGARIVNACKCAAIATGSIRNTSSSKSKTNESWKAQSLYYFKRNLISRKLQCRLLRPRFETYDIKDLIQEAVDYERFIKTDSKCYICYEKTHTDEHCVSMFRNYDILQVTAI